MKSLVYNMIALSLFFSYGCEKYVDNTSSENKYRTVFFGKGRLRIPRSAWASETIDVRIMVDTATPPGFHFLIATDLWSEFPADRYSHVDRSLKPSIFPYYTTYYIHGPVKSRPSLLFANYEYPYQALVALNYAYSCYVGDLSHQRYVTGRDIDIVVGTSWAHNSCIPDGMDYESWTWPDSSVTLESGETVKLLEYFIDEQMQVPYDWAIDPRP